ncbi:MAG: hypothetical protein AAF525_23155 [Pseudomonadota bacterium]
MPISVTVDQGVTIFRTRGVISSYELATTIGDFYEGQPTRLVLWDNREADFSTISSTELQNLAQIPAESADKRRDAKTATVVSDDFHHGLARMSDAYLDTAEAPTGLAIFRSYDEAMTWLLQGTAEPFPDADI